MHVSDDPAKLHGQAVVLTQSIQQAQQYLIMN